MQCAHRLVATGLRGGGALIGAASVLLAPCGLAVPAMVFGWQLLLLGMIDVRHLWLPRGLVALLAVSGTGFAAWRSWQAASLAPLGLRWRAARSAL